MDQLMQQLLDYISVACQILAMIVILATCIVRLTPTPKDDELVYGYASKFWKVVNWLPTFGINPRTKKLEEAYKEARGEKSD